MNNDQVVNQVDRLYEWYQEECAKSLERQFERQRISMLYYRAQELKQIIDEVQDAELAGKYHPDRKNVGYMCVELGRTIGTLGSKGVDCTQFQLKERTEEEERKISERKMKRFRM